MTTQAEVWPDKCIKLEAHRERYVCGLGHRGDRELIMKISERLGTEMRCSVSGLKLKLKLEAFCQ